MSVVLEQPAITGRQQIRRVRLPQPQAAGRRVASLGTKTTKPSQTFRRPRRYARSGSIEPELATVSATRLRARRLNCPGRRRKRRFEWTETGLHPRALDVSWGGQFGFGPPQTAGHRGRSLAEAVRLVGGFSLRWVAGMPVRSGFADQIA